MYSKLSLWGVVQNPARDRPANVRACYQNLIKMPEAAVQNKAGRKRVMEIKPEWKSLLLRRNC
ncbi:hypothetical protein C3432_14135 [Citrobacter amalonaticus]|uniref:Uncharacterized protein n=1 Tax=Citrobacter amalonaticus TaxID=35703 RepID=A0A2S4RWC7_CITAM|nr:hypothetical protein C3432_14135 [Citrobacter amalonaticus]POT75074.1 hypothetical protein C3436_14605 [Citrobacter amalonaticus]POU64603.1 hypothetical protein C3430_15625 [Citrobacter amalonaticus]POV04439.1 hypothetical protein C3424_14945 [Citrobacter amalonaticus]